MESKSSTDLRVLFLTLEYAEPYIFSGNGVYSRSFVHNLVRSGGTRVMVLCGRPAGQQTRPRPTPTVKTNGEIITTASNFVANPDFTREGTKVEVYTVSLPVWFKLDRHSSWREFGEGVLRFAPKVAQFKPDIVLGVDWTSRSAWESLRKHPETRLSSVPFVYLCFRVFSATPGLVQEERTFFAQREAEIIQSAVRTVALSRCDAAALDDLRTMTLPRGADAIRTSSSLIQVITPPLRDDVRNASVKLTRLPAAVPQQKKKWSWSHSQLAAPLLPGSSISATDQSSSFRYRNFVTCCCRLSPEKEVMRFVEMVETIQRFLKDNELIPYLVGPAADEEYARKVYQRLKRAFPGDSSIIVSDFVPADKLQAIFARTVLNVHPARMEPFGMSITEAAAFGVPTLLDGGGLVGAVDVLPPGENKSITCNMRNVRQASLMMKSLLRMEGRPFLELVGKRAQDAVLRWGSTEWAIHVRKELLEDVLRNSFRAYRLRESSNGNGGGAGGAIGLFLGGGGGSNGNDEYANNNECGEDDETYLWLAITQWAAEQLLLMNDESVLEQIVHEEEGAGEGDGDNNRVMQLEVDGVRLVVEQLVKLTAYSLASLLIHSKQNKHTIPLEMTPEMFEWARCLLSRYNNCLGPARFRLVPSRMNENTFWGLFFALVKDGVARLMNQHRNHPDEKNNAVNGAASHSGTTNDVDKQHLQSNSNENGGESHAKMNGNGSKSEENHHKESTANNNSAVVDSLEERAAAMERLVQRDECGRGIAPIVEFVGKGVLLESARSLLNANRVLILTGFPCLLNAPSPQETDGPPGAVAIARACVHLGKRVMFVVEEPIAEVMRACVKKVFPKTRSMLLRSHGLTKVESYGAKGQVTLEIFPPKVNFVEGHYLRLNEILNELASDKGQMVAIERAGPAHDGKCRTMRARVMDDSLLAPLHVLFEHAKEVKVATIGIGDGGNEVGMGTAYDVVKAKMGEEIACVVGCDFLLPSSVSNWGGHALCGALGLVAKERGMLDALQAADLCVGPDQVHMEVIQACLEAGAADGITGQRNSPAVDGLPFSKTLEVIQALRSVVERS